MSKNTQPLKKYFTDMCILHLVYANKNKKFTQNKKDDMINIGSCKKL